MKSCALKSFLVRLGAVAAGLVLAACLLEIALAALGAFWSLRLAARDSALALCGGSFRVLCVGDSYTYGQGAPEGSDFPSQLEGMLRACDVGAKVANRGRPGANTRVVLENLEKDLREVMPSVVFVLAGRANDWNSHGLDRALDARQGRRLFAAGAFERLRVVKLARLLCSNLFRPWRGRPTAAAPADLSGPADQGLDYYRVKPEGEGLELYREGIDAFYRRDFDRAFGNFSRLSRMYPDAFEYCQLASQSLVAKGDNAAAAAFLESALERSPQVPQIYEYLAKEHIEAGRDRDAVALALRSAAFAPDNAAFFDILFYVFQYANAPGAKDEIRSGLKTLKTRTAREFLRRFDAYERADARENALRRWVLSDLRGILRLCRERGLTVILQSYPQDPFLRADMAALARESGYPFCDQFAVFNALAESERELCFAIDGHCSARGYRLMAQNNLELLLSTGLCPAGKGAKGVRKRR